MKNNNYSKRFTQAFEFVAEQHQHQLRTGTNIPYLSHLMSVSALVWENKGDEDQAIAGLLHDVIEDANPPSSIPEIKQFILKQFGERVLALVEGCTDGEPNEAGEKLPWRLRKENYLAHLKDKSEDLLLVSCCDKLHNARSIVTDLDAIGEDLFNRFTGKKTGTIWYYQCLLQIYQERISHLPAVNELAKSVDAMKRFI